MSTAALDATLQTLNQSVTNRLADEDRFKREVYDKINQLLAGLNVCASAVASAPSNPARAAAVVDLTAQVRALNQEVARLQANRLTGADSDYVTQPLRTEANNQTVKWDTLANKNAFVPPDYRGGPSVGPPPPYPGRPGSAPSSSASSGFPFSFPSLPSLPSFSPPRSDGITPIVPVRGIDDPRNRRGGWTPRRTPRRTPRHTPKKKTYRQ
jgi:hypothetical protein